MKCTKYVACVLHFVFFIVDNIKNVYTDSSLYIGVVPVLVISLALRENFVACFPLYRSCVKL